MAENQWPAGNTDHTIYSIRNSFVDRMKEAGLDDELRRIMMGHFHIPIKIWKWERPDVHLQNPAFLHFLPILLPLILRAIHRIFSLMPDPTDLIAKIDNTEINAAMSPYSSAVAPLSSFINRLAKRNSLLVILHFMLGNPIQQGLGIFRNSICVFYFLHV